MNDSLVSVINKAVSPLAVRLMLAQPLINCHLVEFPVVKQAQVTETNVQSTVNTHHSQTSKWLAIDQLLCDGAWTHRHCGDFGPKLAQYGIHLSDSVPGSDGAWISSNSSRRTALFSFRSWGLAVRLEVAKTWGFFF